MNWTQAILAGFVGTVVLTTLLSASRGLGHTRMDIPLMIGTIFTPDRDRAKWIGFFVHFLNGWIFAFIYIGIFHYTRVAHWALGIVVGLFHSLFLLVVVMNVLPCLHPRMATEQRGPDPTRELEPPGYLALHYGSRTPIATIASHLLFGFILGLLY